MDDIELEHGLKLTWVNAKSLIEEADLLFSNKYHCRAYALYQLAIEELGKCKILMFSLTELYLNHSVNEKTLDNHGFRDHKIKFKTINDFILNLITLYHKETGNTTGFYKELYDDHLRSKEINEKKNHSLYVNLINGKFELPDRLICNEDTVQIKRKVKIYCDSIGFWIKPRAFYKNLAYLLNSAQEKFGN